MNDGQEIPQTSQTMELESFTDLLRLVSIMNQNRSVSRHVYFAKKDDTYVFFLTHSINGWYNLKGLPVTLVVYVDEEPTDNFIKYSLGKENEEEKYEFVGEIKNTAEAAFIPIIRLKEVPDFML